MKNTRDTNTASSEGDVIDARAGDGQVIGSQADDRIQGADAKSHHQQRLKRHAHTVGVAV